MQTATESTATTRTLDGVTLVFQRYDDLWMIDRVSLAANDQDDDETFEETDGGACFEQGTAVTRDEVSGRSELDLRRYHARQVRRLGLPARGVGARLLWSMIRDFERFAL